MNENDLEYRIRERIAIGLTLLIASLVPIVMKVHPDSPEELMGKYAEKMQNGEFAGISDWSEANQADDGGLR